MTAGETEEDDCAFCLSPAEDPLPLECRHRFCRACVAAYKRHSGVNDVCPLCRAPLPPGAEQLVDRAWRLAGLREKWQQQRNHGSATRVLQSMLRFGREAVNLDPEHGSARFLLGWASNEAGDVDGAEREYRSALRIDPNHVGSHFNLGLLLRHARNDVDGAEREYQSALRIDPNHVDSRLNLGSLLVDARNDVDGAEREYRSALRIDPNHVDSRVNLGILLINARNDVDGAEREWRAALRFDPNHIGSHCNLGSLLKNARNDVDGAMREYQSALRIDPNIALTHWNLHHLYCTKGDREGAMHEVREFIRCGGHPGVDGEARLAQLQRSAR